jgi:hypothetical protein
VDLDFWNRKKLCRLNCEHGRGLTTLQATVSGKLDVFFLDVVAGSDTFEDMPVEGRGVGQVCEIDAYIKSETRTISRY